MSRTIQKAPNINLAKLKTGQTYIFYFRSGGEVEDQLDPNWKGRINPHRLLKRCRLYDSDGLYHREQGSTPCDIIQVSELTP